MHLPVYVTHEMAAASVFLVGPLLDGNGKQFVEDDQVACIIGSGWRFQIPFDALARHTPVDETWVMEEESTMEEPQKCQHKREVT